VGCILYALYEGKPKKGQGGDNGFRQEHSWAFVVGLILIIVSFQ